MLPPTRPQLQHSTVPLPPRPIPMPAFLAPQRACDVLPQHATKKQAADAVEACRDMKAAHKDDTRQVGGFTLVAKVRHGGRTDVHIHHTVAGVSKIEGLKQLKNALGGLLDEKELKNMKKPQRKRCARESSSAEEEEEEEEEEGEEDDDDVAPSDPPSRHTRGRTAAKPVVEEVEEEEEVEIQGYVSPSPTATATPPPPISATSPPPTRCYAWADSSPASGTHIESIGACGISPFKPLHDDNNGA